MKKIFKKNQVIITALAIMIAVAGYINYSDSQFGTSKEKKTEDTKETASETQEIVEEIESLDYDITDETAMLEENQKAQEQEGETETEAETETPGEAAELLLEAQGFSNIVVNLTGDSADVIVPKEYMEDARRAQIEDIVKRKTSVPAENIVITPLEGESEEKTSP